jgi:hypothetical protein
MQQFLKPAARTARAEVVAPELLDQLLVAVDDAVAASHPGLAEGTPGAVYSCAQKESRVSRSCSVFRAIKAST